VPGLVALEADAAIAAAFIVLNGDDNDLPSFVSDPSSAT